MEQLKINFDFLILLLFGFCILKGAIRGVFNQIRATFMIGLPLIVLFSLGRTILATLKSIDIYQKVVLTLYQGLSYVFTMSSDYFFNLFSYMLICVLIGLVVHLSFLVFMPSKKRRILSDKKPASRIVGAILGGVNGYFCIFILFMVMHTVVTFNVDAGLTKVFVSLHRDLLNSLMGAR